MDEATVRQHAETHGQAVVDGDMSKAGGDIDGEALAQAGDVIKQLPREVDSADVESVDVTGDSATVRIRYSGEGRSLLVVSNWEDREGRPKITSLSVG
ncbi:MAG: hypothetical protein M3R70_03005 [Actinomycetota bacterium]|nr:hypothetical protein [Actinomycetota bacterium]